MEWPVELIAASELKAFIAARYLGLSSDAEMQIGSVKLHAHQIAAVDRIRVMIDAHRGALLADDVGMGKTFVALAVARSFERVAVIAPAGLRDMWTQSAIRAQLRVAFHSFEFLSRGGKIAGTFDFIIVDEAHHARNPATVRYQQLSKALARSRVLLLSATPIHNRPKDICALLALFLGARAHALTPEEISRCVVRRRISAAEAKIPELESVTWWEVDDDADITRRLLALPPPVPPRDGGLASNLVVRSLLRAWCSSEAALRSAIARRLGRCAALKSSLESGFYPNEKELAAWTFIEDSLQLAFPSLVSTSFGSCGEILKAVSEHEFALRQILGALRGSPDAARAGLIGSIREKHNGVSIVAFSQYIATVSEMFRLLRAEPGVGVITANGARVAGGAISRRDALDRFAPRASGARSPSRAERIDLLLATDLLSEGVNLQDARVVIHLDLPWTAARLEQRIGRVRRIASAHSVIHVYGIRPAASAEQLLHLDGIIARKARDAQRVIGSSMHATGMSRAGENDPVSSEEMLRGLLRTWINQDAHVTATDSGAIAVGGVKSVTHAVLALVSHEGKPILVGLTERGSIESSAALLDLLHSIGKDDVTLEERDVITALERCRAWLIKRATLGPTSVAEMKAARARRKAINRVGSLVRNARVHSRPGVFAFAESTRNRLLGSLSVGLEAELDKLSQTAVNDSEWLRDLESKLEISGRAPDDSPPILAVMVLVS